MLTLLLHGLINMRKNDCDSWQKLTLLFDAADIKQTIYGVLVDSEIVANEDNIFSAQKLVQMATDSSGENQNVFVIGDASLFTACLNASTDEFKHVMSTKYIRLSLQQFESLQSLQFTFFGDIALEGRAPSIDLAASIPTSQDAPALPWQVSGGKFDSLMSCECACAAWLIPKTKLVAGKSGSKKCKPDEKDKENKSSTSNVADTTAGSSMDALAAIALGTQSAKGQGKGRKGGAAKGKAKAKAKAKSKKNAEPEYEGIQFVDEPLFLVKKMYSN